MDIYLLFTLIVFLKINFTWVLFDVNNLNVKKKFKHAFQNENRQVQFIRLSLALLDSSHRPWSFPDSLTLPSPPAVF